MDLSLIIPARNEANRIPPVLASYVALLSRQPLDFEIVVVVNNSSDDTAGIVRTQARQLHGIRVIECGDVGGKGGAVRIGVAESVGDLVGFVDADGAVGPEQFAQLLRSIPRHGGAIASRRLPESEILPQRPVHRALAASVFSCLVRAITSLPFRDTQCGGKVFHRSALEAIWSDLSETGWCFDVEWLLLLQQRSIEVIEVPIVWTEQAGSQLRLHRDGFAMLRDLSRIFRRIKSSRHVGTVEPTQTSSSYTSVEATSSP